MAHVDKQMKDAFKEGLKKAQHFSIVNKAGGLRYFCATSDISEDQFDILQNVMNGMNSDKKAKLWGKLVLSCNDNCVIGIGYVPTILSEMNAEEWVMELLNCVPDMRKCETIVDVIDNEYVKIVVKIKKDEEIFAFKLCSDIVDNNVSVLRGKNILPEKSGESEDEDYAAAVGIEW